MLDYVCAIDIAFSRKLIFKVIAQTLILDVNPGFFWPSSDRANPLVCSQTTLDTHLFTEGYIFEDAGCEKCCFIYFPL